MSALEQTYKNIEIIVVNDGSKDNGETDKIALSFGKKIRYFTKQNGGVASALNLGIKQMTGEYFSWLSHDDLYLKDKISTQINILSSLQSSSRAILYSDYALLTKDENSILPIRIRKIDSFRYWLTMESQLNGCTLLIPYSILKEFNGFDEKLKTVQDYDLWFKIAGKYPFIHIPQILVKSRIHAGQDSIQKQSLAFNETSALLAKFVKFLHPQEIFVYQNQSLGEAYLNIAKRMWIRGFARAGKIASVRAYKEGVSPFVINAIFLIAVLQNRIFKSLRKILNPNVRIQCKKLLQKYL